MVEYYTAEKVTDAVTCIRSMTGELLYLIEGAAEALLVDSCLGVGRLEGQYDRVFISHHQMEVHKEICRM